MNTEQKEHLHRTIKSLHKQAIKANLPYLLILREPAEKKEDIKRHFNIFGSAMEIVDLIIKTAADDPSFMAVIRVVSKSILAMFMTDKTNPQKN